MQCWKCSGQVVDGICTLCGCLQSSRKSAVTDIGRMLRYVYDKFGAQRTLTEDGLLVRCLPDILPDEIELRQALTAAMRLGAGQEFYALLSTNHPLNDATFQRLVNALQAADLSENDVRLALASLWEMAGCGTPSNPAAQPTNPLPQERAMRETPRQIQPEISRKAEQSPASQVLASLANVVLADATHGINAMKSNGRSGMLFLKPDGVAMHYYERQIGISKNRAWHQVPDIFIPMQSINRLIVHDSGLTYDFTLVLKDGVRFQVISSAYSYNRKDAKQFAALIQERL